VSADFRFEKVLADADAATADMGVAGTDSIADHVGGGAAVSGGSALTLPGAVGTDVGAGSAGSAGSAASTPETQLIAPMDRPYIVIVRCLVLLSLSVSFLLEYGIASRVFVCCRSESQHAFMRSDNACLFRIKRFSLFFITINPFF
jgi:hypothetical protein